MSLASGSRLGVYDITSQIGVGGMGEVYRARDTKLDRDVALKILPSAFAEDAERVARFRREAKTLAALNHPHIAQIYGLEETPPSPGTAAAATALVMELVEGEDLAARIRRGPVPVDEALAIARQIADALAAAHEQGIVHRDLKPANVKLRPDGAVKVLDFGLAKAVDPGVGAAGDATASPTITSPAMTAAGMILGTAAYMAPEQAKGRPVDRRADLWAFGCVLYEMLTGRPAFEGETVTDVLGAIVHKEPDWTRLPADTPAPIRRLLRRCLEKDRTRRLDSAAAARLEIDEAMSGAREDATATSASRMIPRGARRRESLAWALASAGALAAVWLAARPVPAPESPAPVGRFEMEVPWGAGSISAPGIALSPDGTQVAVQSSVTIADPGRLYVRRLASTRFVEVRGSEQLRGATWSRDGAALFAVTAPGVAESAFQEIRRIDVATGYAQTVARVSAGLAFSVASGGSGVLLIGVANQPLHVVYREGEEARPLGALNAAAGEIEQQSPVFLPDGRRFFYTSWRQGNRWVTVLRSLDTGESRELAGVDGRVFWANERMLALERNGMVLAQAYSPNPLALQGRPIVLTDGSAVATTVFTGSQRLPAAAAASGVLAYRTRELEIEQFVRVARDGRVVAKLGPEGQYSSFDLSNDGSRLVASRLEAAGASLWLLDAVQGTANRVTTGASDVDPQFSPDGRAVIFGSSRDPARSPFRVNVAGGAPERVFPFDGRQYANDDWSADGQWLLYHDSGVPVLRARRLDRPGKAPVVVARALTGTVDQGRFSRDGKWVAYNSTESGRSEVYVVPFPPTGDRWQVSVGGGAQPLWRQDGRELYYLAGDGALMAVAVTASPAFTTGRPVRMFQSPVRSVSAGLEQYAAAPDGSHFVFRAYIEGTRREGITVVTNWMSLLKEAGQ